MVAPSGFDAASLVPDPHLAREILDVGPAYACGFRGRPRRALRDPASNPLGRPLDQVAPSGANVNANVAGTTVSSPSAA